MTPGQQFAATVTSILVPLFIVWLNIRSERNKQHQENLQRFTKLETMMAPLWEWWNGNGRQ